MKGLLKANSASSQLITLLGITAASFFLLGLIGTLIVAQVTGVSVTSMAEIGKSGTMTPAMITALRGMQVVQFISLFVVPCVLCSILFSNKPATYLGFKAPHTGWYIFMGILIMIVATPFTNWLGELNKNIQFSDSMEKWINEKETDAQQSIKAVLADRSVTNLVLNLILIAGLAAVGEELLFRGMLQRILIRIFKSPWAGIIISAVLFSALHMQFKGFLPRVGLGVLLGAVYWYSGSLWVAIIAHFVYDAALILLVHFNPAMMEDDHVDISASTLAMSASISFLLVAAILRWMILRSKTRYEEVYAEDLSAKDHPF